MPEQVKLALEAIGLEEQGAAVGLGDGALWEGRASGAEDGLRRRGAMEGDVGGQPLTSQRACAKNLVFAEGIEGGDGDGGNGNGVADGIEDLDGVPLCAVRGDVVVHQLDDVAATETMLRDIARQHCILVE